MRYTRCYIVFLKVFVISYSSIAFVGDSIFYFRACFKPVACNHISKHFVIINIGRCCNSSRYYPVFVINTTVILVTKRTLAAFASYTCIRVSRINAFCKFFLLIIIELIYKFFTDLAKLRPNLIDVSIAVYRARIYIYGFAIDKPGVNTLLQDIHKKLLEYFRTPASACLGQHTVIGRIFIKVIIAEPQPVQPQRQLPH